MTWFNLDLGAFSFALLSILFEGIPFLLLGSIVSGFVDVFVSSERVAKLMPKNKTGSVFFAGLLGLVFPICECGSVVVVRRFVKKGMPIGAATAYMLAAPIVSPIVAWSTYQAFTMRTAIDGTVSWQFMLARLGLGFAVAVVMALIIQRLPGHRILQPAMAAEPPRKRTGLQIGGELDFTTLVAQASPGRKIILSLQSAAADFINVAFYFVIGSSLAALFVGVNERVFEPSAQWPFLSIVALMVLASMLCLCSTTDAFVAANCFQAFSIEANLAFLVFGPMFDFKLFFLYGLIFKKRFVAVMGAAMFVIIAFVCWNSGPILRKPKKEAPAPAAAILQTSPATGAS